MTRRTLFITGASTGIGAETARKAVAAGWNVALFARSKDKLDALADELGTDHALALSGDVTDFEELKAAVDAAADHFGGLNAVFANAGRGLDTAGVENGDPDEWRVMLDLNINGLLYTVKAAYPHLKKTKGHAVLTGSVAGKINLPGSIYGASKWFVQGFAGNLSEEMREWGGRCTVICPGMVDTPFFDEAKPDKLKPEDIANAVVYAIQQPDRADVRELVIMPTG
ncbi:SDR family oxidoreductase [Roseovarius atlanticus]|uniref:SDR family oxidoreductase n=1 Tax=Roseovarius atlanticus TaxID=1641875 RepID=UPI001C95A2DC|nr:SDR family oxidoreductase [Roseovarius atlanticus]MBY5990398.1 SDR family oxidoreductase [Roseovarius atlanticus]MBY6126944.1 SDR family oxidoreductase [Roseovarius atlanticus]MBY6151437.1 SDR family oxidoreductase [Roseovarius atlanticus]